MMRYLLSLIILITFSGVAIAQENECEKIWQINKNTYPKIKVSNKEMSCKQVWEDPSKMRILRSMGINPKNNQWMSTGDCEVIDLNNKKYEIYYAKFKVDHSDLWVISDNNENYFAYFRDLGKFDMMEDKFFPTKNSNKKGVELKCAMLGNSEKLKSLLSSYMNNKKIDAEKFSFEDWGK